MIVPPVSPLIPDNSLPRVVSMSGAQSSLMQVMNTAGRDWVAASSCWVWVAGDVGTFVARHPRVVGMSGAQSSLRQVLRARADLCKASCCSLWCCPS